MPFKGTLAAVGNGPAPYGIRLAVRRVAQTPLQIAEIITA